MATAIGTVREMLNEFNRASFLGPIPPEILTMCFGHLPFRYRMPVSHVCRSWRAAALGDPTLWSDISPWSPCNSPELMHMALSRTGDRPVDLKVDSRAPTPPQRMYDAIAPFSLQLRYLAWHSDQPTSSWDFPAPNMECFWSSTTMSITAGFLGGQPGRLRHLYLDCVYLPTVCPALSTVSDLSLALTSHRDTPPSMLRILFDVMPRLEILKIRGITDGAASMLPVGPAPASLTDLWLQSRSWDYDLTPYHLAWDSGNLRHVSLTQYPGIHPNLEHMARGTVLLAVKHSYDKFATCLTFAHSDTVSHSVSVTQLGIANAAALLTDVQLHLSNVHTAMISHVALPPLVGLLKTLPALEHLFVHIMPENELGSYPPPRPRVFAWGHLSCLSDVARATPQLRAITLQVWCGEDRTSSSPNTHDALGLVSQLRTLPEGLPPIEVQGFPADQVASLDLTGLDIQFAASRAVGDLILHQRRESYNPFRQWEGIW